LFIGELNYLYETNMKTVTTQKMLTIANVQSLKWLMYGTWTVIIVLTMVILISEERATTIELVRSEAIAFFHKDVSIRKWAAMHGGVYVSPTEVTPPNPYLSHIPDRDIVSTDGKKLTLMNPAYIYRQLSEEFAKEYGVTGHLTSLNLLRPENLPDQWERKALAQFVKGAKEVSNVSILNGKSVFRLMRPLVTIKECLKCHDHQDYKDGGIQGGITITLPLEKYQIIERREIIRIIGAGSLLWLFGLFGAFFAFHQIKIGLQAHEEAEKELMRKEERNRKILDTVQFGILIIDFQTQNIDYLNPAALSMSGYQYTDLVGKPCHQLVCSKAQGNCPIIDLNEKMESHETVLRCAGGSTVNIMKTVKLIETINGRKIIESFVDISTLKQNQVLLDAHAVRTTEINDLQMRLLAPGLLTDKLALICKSLVDNFSLYFARIWLIGPKDLCQKGCCHANSSEEKLYCFHSTTCLHLKTSVGKYTHLDGAHGRIPLGAYKIGQLATGEQRKFITNQVSTDPRIHDHQWARKHNLVSFAGYRLMDQDYKTVGVMAMFAKHQLDNDDIHLSRMAEVVSQIIVTEKAADKLAQALFSAERLNKLTMGREKRIMAMKLEVNKLLIAAGNPPKYKGTGEADNE